MAGLLSDVLPFVYSQGDRAKRYLTGLLADPVGTLQQTAAGIVDAGRAQQGLLGQAFGNHQRPFEVTDKGALAQAANNVMAGPISFAPAGITVWHGSPHTFDKFDASKIGTGEGAQVYGHGLYLAESPKVAQTYKDKLGEVYHTVNGVPAQTEGEKWAVIGLSKYKDPEQAKAQIQRLADAGFPDAQRAAQFAADGIAAVDRFAGKSVDAGIGGSMYKVDLPDDAALRMLDWDRPLSQQPSAYEAWRKAMQQHMGRDPSIDAGSVTGAQAYNMLTGGTAGMHGYEDMTARATEAARRAGIPGIRYLDQGSRNTGGGTSNFVVFPGEENLLTILERNGVPLK